jgi:hypothetical protein
MQCYKKNGRSARVQPQASGLTLNWRSAPQGSFIIYYIDIYNIYKTYKDIYFFVKRGEDGSTPQGGRSLIIVNLRQVGD